MTDTNGQEGLRSLLERVRAATGPDHGLNVEIHDVLRQTFEMEYWSESDTSPIRNLSKVPTYLASIDAALALSERMVGNGWFPVLMDATRALGVAGTEPPSALARYIIIELLSALQVTP